MCIIQCFAQRIFGYFGLIALYVLKEKTEALKHKLLKDVVKVLMLEIVPIFDIWLPGGKMI